MCWDKASYKCQSGIYQTVSNYLQIICKLFMNFLHIICNLYTEYLRIILNFTAEHDNKLLRCREIYSIFQ